MPGTIIRRGKAWVVVIDHGRDERGHRVRKWTSFPTRREAEAYEIQSAIHPGFASGLGPYGSPRTRLNGYLQQWLQDYAKPNVRASTYRRYAEFSRIYIVPGLGHLQLARLSPQAIESFYRSLSGKISPTTALHIATLLRGALQTALRWGLILQNPCDRVEKPKPSRWEPMLWGTEETMRFIAGARSTKHWLLYALLLTTGLRLGEALALTWQDIDLKSGLLMVRQGKTPNARRVLRLPDELVNELRAVRGVGLVFHTKLGNRLDTPTLRRDHFYPLLKRLGLPRIRLHDLRHSHATMLLAQGVDIATVSARLGHASRAFTLSTYAHAMATGQERAAEVANLLLTKSGPQKAPWTNQEK